MSLTNLERYRYEPLPGDGSRHIRIATIHPGCFDEDVCVSLRVEEFQVVKSSPSNLSSAGNNVPYYEAMSYCWDGPGDSGRILVHNEGSLTSEDNLDNRSEEDAAPIWNQWLPVRANLLCALRHLRHQADPREMWIDAICIDQDDVVQKGPQVAMMGMLYSWAAAVVIWLGPAADDSDRAMELLKDWGSQVNFDIWTGILRPSTSLPPQARNHKIADMNSWLDCHSEEILAVYHLFSRQWFDRLWVRQEIGLANTAKARVQCGSMAMPWEVFRNAWGALHTKHLSPDPDNTELRTSFKHRMDQLRSFLQQTPRTYLCWVRSSFAETRCHDARDRIYAIRSMLGDEDVKDAIVPDYTKTMIEAYQDAAIAYFRYDSEGDIRILEDCRLHPDWNGPSWAPDWSRPDRTTTVLLNKRASGFFLPSPKACEIVDGGVIRVHGVVLTEVVQICSQASSQPSAQEIHSLLAGEPRGMDDSYPAGGTVLDAYVRALGNERYQDTDLTPGAKGMPHFETVRDQLLQVKKGELQALTTEVLALLRRTLTGRVFLRTQSGLLGLSNGEGCIQPGDQICAVFGCRRLLVLRPRGRQYQVAGDCFLDGADFGEGVLGPLPQHFRHVFAEIKSGNAKQVGWVFQNTLSGEVVREDPRLLSLGLDLADYRRRLEEGDIFPWLRVSPDTLKECLLARGVCVRTFDLI